jgi:hypothetical protein
MRLCVKAKDGQRHGKFVLFFSVSHLVFVTGKESAQSAFDLFWIIVQLNFGQPATKNK